MRFRIIPADASLPPEADDGLRRLLAYWRSKCAAGRLPRRRDIDPLEIAPLLPSVFLVDVEAEDFRFSLVGETIASRYGRLKGRTLRELMSGAELDQTLDEHQLCVTARLPVYSENTLRSASAGDWQIYQRLLTPLVSEEGPVTSLAGMMVLRHYQDS